MAVRARAVVPEGRGGGRTAGTGPAGLDELGGVDGKGRCLLTREGDRGTQALLVLFDELFDDHDQAVALLVVGDADAPDDPVRVGIGLEVEVLGRCPGRPSSRTRRAR